MKALTSKSAVFLCTVFLLLTTSCGITFSGYKGLKTSNKIEDTASDGTYLVKNDGTIIKGERIFVQTGTFANKIRTDQVKFSINEIKAYRLGNNYYGRYKNEYMKRIVRGAMNIYYIDRETQATSVTSPGGTIPKIKRSFFYQKGDNGPLIQFSGFGDIKKILKDCPASYALVNKNGNQLNRLIKKDANYLNAAFDTYNRECGDKH